MRERNRTEDRDEVLFAFHQECARPTADQIIEWVRKYPEFAEDIRAHAAIARDWASHENALAEEPDESPLATAYSRALNIIYNVDNAQPQQKASDVSKSFQQYFVVKGTDTPAVARALDIDRVVIADLVSGRMLPPIGKRLIAAVSSHLSITAQEFDGVSQPCSRRANGRICKSRSKTSNKCSKLRSDYSK